MNTDELWEGAFGDEYHRRNAEADTEGLVSFFYEALEWPDTGEIRRIVEFGAGLGHNIAALHELYPAATLDAVEINHGAAVRLRESKPYVVVHEASIFGFTPMVRRFWDLVVTSGLLIHLPPERLAEAYQVLYDNAARYILLCEYYCPQPREILYRGQKKALWARDFAGEMMDRFSDLYLRDYGFVYHREKHAPKSDVTWFLLERVPESWAGGSTRASA